MFDIKPVTYDGNCGYHSILKCLKCLKSTERCNKTYDFCTLRKDMFDILLTEKYIQYFKRSLSDLNDLNE